MAMINKNVALVGASDDPEKYAYKALRKLKENGYRVFPINPSLKTLEGQTVYASISDIPEAVDTVTLYVSAPVSTKISGEILAKKPERIIFNPGAENDQLEALAASRGIKTLKACTLVMLSTHQFEK